MLDRVDLDLGGLFDLLKGERPTLTVNDISLFSNNSAKYDPS
jgi:hypothetical protein